MGGYTNRYVRAFYSSTVLSLLRNFVSEVLKIDFILFPGHSCGYNCVLQQNKLVKDDRYQRCGSILIGIIFYVEFGVRSQ